MKYDVTIIGCGITGASIAFELSKYNLKVCVLEKNNDVAMQTTKANSGIVHAGYDPKPGTKMARLNVLGCQMYEELAKTYNVHYKKCGSLVIGRTENDKKIIEELYDRGVKNKVPGIKILSKEELKEMEPNLNDDIFIALYAPSCGIVSPWEMCLAFAENAVLNGVDLKLSTQVLQIEKNEDFLIKTNNGEFESKYLINCAGLYADEIYQMVLKDKKCPFKITPVKGEYYLLDKNQGNLVNHVVFQTPNELGKGVLVSPTVHGNLIVGPNAITVEDKRDVSTKQTSLDYIRKCAALTTDKISYRDNIRNFSGVRANVDGLDDFIIEESKEVNHFINFAGIKSPGLTSAPAFGLEVVNILKNSGLNLEKKSEFKVLPLEKHFKDLTKDEINERVKKDPRYGRIICRCETISEGEIVSALHRPFVVSSIDAIKRRTNAGMGRCQGGFCSPKVLEIIKRELNIKASDVLQDNTGSNIVLSHTKGGDENE